ncbi:glycosyltransferase family 2 protein [Pseudarthrobacter sp. C1]|uniref:glycosyltransferase family 2 protein n=1 Tax=Pseudarthrobacter sp. C1 TaxID=3108940 RepID=UPI002B053FF6|nr:glycosyltransferase [Pseudarthrobacter sp. C1]MEA3550265.1 glycosyltransferase [Pseudarthrobacter sp. C1]
MNISLGENLVSVVIPCFNDKPEHIQECIKSVLSQSYPRVEIVVVDDGSTDPGTKDALRSLPESVHLVRSENRGPSAARNLGISKSAGVFILPLDADDWINPQFVAAAVGVALDRDVQIAYPDVQEFGASCRLKRPPQVITLADLVSSNLIASCALFPRARWAEVGGYDESLRHGFEDYELWVRLLRDGGAARKAIPAVLHYRQRDSSRRSDLAVADALAITRAKILTNNKEHLHTLLTAAWERTDALSVEVGKAWNDPLQLRRWLRWTKPASAYVRRGFSRFG